MWYNNKEYKGEFSVRETKLKKLNYFILNNQPTHSPSIVENLVGVSWLCKKEC